MLELLAEERASVSSVVDERAWKVHVADSLTGLEVPELRGAERIADVGAGAGFPGLALAVALPDAQVDLVESVGRKCAFMSRADRGGRHPQRHRPQHPLRGPGAERRAARPTTSSPPAPSAASRPWPSSPSPLLKPNGVLVAWKGKRDDEEEAQMTSAAETLAMRPEQILDVGNRAGSQHRHLHVIRKSGPTPANLPRKPGIAKKRPKG